MAEAVAGLFLSPVITYLVEKLGSAVLQEFARLEGIHSLINKWTGKLGRIQSVINDAEDKQISDASVKQWLQSLRELAYDLDDIVDELTTEASRRHDMMESELSQPSRSMVSTYLGACCTLSPRSVYFNSKMVSNFKDMTIRLEEIEKQKNELHLRELADGGISKRNDGRLRTTSLVDECDVYGREEKKKEIMELLLAKEAGKKDVCVIPIVGMGGIGKTTLAQLVYNDPRVDENFDYKAWVCVSDKLDVLEATKTIFNAVMEEGDQSKDLNTLQESLKKKLSTKRFLIILDDVWNQEYEKWDLLIRPFQSGRPGSKVIVTTRNDGVASLCSPSVPPCRVEILTNDDCLSILALHALETKNFDMHPNLKKIGEDLAERCDGLPLAAKALGGVLRSKVHSDEWKDILNSNIWELPQENNILPVLRLSYHHLPSHLKLLFAYCSIFPKDYKFDKWELVLLWMGEGLLRQPDGRKTIEDVGIESFNELMSRSFFQPLSGSDSRFVMHDLIHDLSEFVAGGTCHRLDKEGDIFKLGEGFANTRHASFLRQTYDTFKKFEALYNVRGLRTFISLPMCRGHEFWFPNCHLSNRVLLQLLPGLRSLRVLALGGYNISEVPSSIDSLIHLRYLNLDFTNITSLPLSLGKLYNLETLSIRYCHRIRKLPKTLKNLVNLRHLDNSSTSKLEEMPMGIGKLTNLQTLSKVIIGKDCGFRLTELKDLPRVGGSLSIRELQNVDLQEARDAGLKHKTNLRRLALMWRYSIDVSYDASSKEDVMDKLEPPRELEKLKICGFGGSKFPKWIGDDLSFLKLESIRLDHCTNCTAIPPLGTLPMLKHLEIINMPKVICLGKEFFMGCHPIEHAFPSLMTLKFSNLLEWEEWSWCCSDEEVGVQFPSLRELSLSYCPKLSKVSPQKLPLLCTLYLNNCNKLVIDSLKDLSSLATLRLMFIVGLSNLPKEFMELAEKKIEVLRIDGCDDLVALWQNGVIAQNLMHLRELCIQRCSQLIYLGEDNPLPPNLEVMELSECKSLTCLPNELSSLTSLQELRISDCPRLVNLPDNGIPSTLTTLGIRNCNALTSLPTGMSGLKSLALLSCSSLKGWPADYMPTSHERIIIQNCSHLEQVQEERFSSANTVCVEYLTIGRWKNLTSFLKHIPLFSHLVCLTLCELDSLESFPDQSLHNPNLRSLFITRCSNLKSLPLHLHKISSLKYLQVWGCQQLEAFRGGDLPLSLTSLIIRECEKLKPLAEWQLTRLTGLTAFEIWGGFPDLVSFDEDDFIFPPTLTDLHIQDFPNLKSLSKGLDCIISLEHLRIETCPKLRKLPSQGLLNRLQSLRIENCSGLKGKFESKIADFAFVRTPDRMDMRDFWEPSDLDWFETMILVEDS